MVSGLGSHVQLFSTELALKAISKQEAVSASLPQHSTIDPSLLARCIPTPEVETVRKAGRISLSEQAETLDLSPKVTSASFMRELKLWLADLSCDRMNFSRGCAMLQAFASSTLKVFDPVEGVVVKAGDRDTEVSSEQISAVGWSQFLKSRVKREADNAYSKDEDGNYVDLISGEQAYFGAVGSKFYYFTWP